MSATYSFPTSSASSLWTETFATGSGGGVVELNGVGYGELLNSQSGEALSINSITIQPFESASFDEDEQISQLLEPIKFTRKNADGKELVYSLTPTVDYRQSSPTLKFINLGKRADVFVFDGNTRLSYDLLPFATVNIQFEYTKVTNLVFGKPEVLKKVVALNRKRNAEFAEEGKTAKTILVDEVEGQDVQTVIVDNASQVVQSGGEVVTDGVKSVVESSFIKSKEGKLALGAIFMWWLWGVLKKVK